MERFKVMNTLYARLFYLTNSNVRDHLIILGIFVFCLWFFFWYIQKNIIAITQLPQVRNKLFFNIKSSFLDIRKNKSIILYSNNLISSAFEDNSENHSMISKFDFLNQEFEYLLLINQHYFTDIFFI